MIIGCIYNEKWRLNLMSHILREKALQHIQVKKKKKIDLEFHYLVLEIVLLLPNLDSILKYMMEANSWRTPKFNTKM